MAVLIDTSFLLAAIFPKDSNHAIARQTVRSLDEAQSLILQPVLQELFYMTTVRVGYRAAHTYLAQINKAAFDILPLTAEDRQRMTEIMRQYESAAFDYTDTAIMAVAERLNIQRVYSFDHRDFQIFRPKHGDFLDLRP